MADRDVLSTRCRCLITVLVLHSFCLSVHQSLQPPARPLVCCLMDIILVISQSRVNRRLLFHLSASGALGQLSHVFSAALR